MNEKVQKLATIKPYCWLGLHVKACAYMFMLNQRVVRVKRRLTPECCCSLFAYRSANSNQRDSAAVEVDNSTWSLTAETSVDGTEAQVLSILLVRPPLTEDDIKWKKGENYLCEICHQQC